MFIRLSDTVNKHKKYVNVNYVTAVMQLRTGETLVEYIGGCCYSNLNPEDLVSEIERIKNEENK